MIFQVSVSCFIVTELIMSRQGIGMFISYDGTFPWLLESLTHASFTTELTMFHGNLRKTQQGLPRWAPEYYGWDALPNPPLLLLSL